MKQKNIILVFTMMLFAGISLLSQDYYNSKAFKHFDLEKKELNKADKDSVSIFINHWLQNAFSADDSIAMAYIWMYGSRLYQRLDQFDVAIDYGLKADKIIKQHDLSNEFTLNKNFLSVLYLVEGSFEKAMILALESVDEFEIYYPYENRSNYFVLAGSYLAMHNYERMDYYLQKWYALVKEKNKRMDLGFAIHSIHEHYDKAEMYEQASFFQREFYKFYVENNPETTEIPEHALMTITGDSNEDKIIKLLKYLPYHEASQHYSLISKTNRHLGKLYMESGEIIKAITHLEKATKNPKGISLERQIDAHNALSEAYTINSQYEKALASTNKYITLLDSFQNNQVIAQANELEVKYENEKKELQLEIQENQIQAKNNWLLFSTIAGLFVLATAFFIFYLYRKIRINNGILSKTLDEKETLLQEIHHRVKNNLQVISSLLSLQSKYVKDENAVSALNEGQNRVESMALIHQNLYRSDNISGVNMRNYIPLLADNIFKSYNIQGEKITIEYEIDEITLDVATVIPIGLVLNELISNALKYAFLNKEKGMLKVSLLEKSNSILLAVVDDGIGMKDKNVEVGFGSKLIRSFTRKLDGELSIKSDDGTAIEILIKNFKRA